jgi:hypothetical protein
MTIDDKIQVTTTPTAVTATLPCHNPDGSLWNMIIVITPRSRRRNPTVELYGGEVRYKLDALDPANAAARGRFLSTGVHPEYSECASALLIRAADEYLGQWR